jgi:predicted RNA-binding Zn ribbon-like protein
MTELHDAPPEPSADDELFIEFVNSLRPAERAADRPRDGRALRDWLATRGLVDADTPIDRVEARLPAFRELRALVHGITERLAADGRPSARQVQRLNRVLREGLHYHRLQPAEDGTRFTVGQVGDRLDQARASIAGSLAHYVAEHDLERLRICAADDCRWRFVDRSPAGRRRWCDMKTCGNRAKVARHRARARSAEKAPATVRRRSGARPS